MPTGATKGLNPARQLGSGVDNKGLNSYTIASAYATALGKGDPVALSSGTLVVATNGNPVIGVFHGVNYVTSQNDTKIQKYWPAGQVATQIEALVMDSPSATFHVVGNAAVGSVVPGQIYAVTVGTPDALTGRSNMVADISNGVVAANAGMIKVIKVEDVDARVLEVVLVNHALATGPAGAVGATGPTGPTGPA